MTYVGVVLRVTVRASAARGTPVHTVLPSSRQCPEASAQGRTHKRRLSQTHDRPSVGPRERDDSEGLGVDPGACGSAGPVAAVAWRTAQQDRDGSRIHGDSPGEAGARLGPCGITTATPQHFTVVSRPAAEGQPRSFLHRGSPGTLAWTTADIPRSPFTFSRNTPIKTHVATGPRQSTAAGRGQMQSKYGPEPRLPASPLTVRERERNKNPFFY
jgi:hypothetical protein